MSQEKYKHKAEKLTRQKTGLSNGLKIQIKYSAWCVTSHDGFFAECKSKQDALLLANKLTKLRCLEQPW
jgi:hypothetical protein